MYWFTADEHYFHHNIIKYSERPFDNVREMNETLIANHNSKVQPEDTTIHAGDFTLIKDKRKIYKEVIDRLNGNHIFLKGSHDYWLSNYNSQQIWERKIGQNYFVVCHYAMLTWARSHYNSFQLFGHSHGKLTTSAKQYDVGVDNNNFYPVSVSDIVRIMRDKPDNPNLIRKKR